MPAALTKTADDAWESLSSELGPLLEISEDAWIVYDLAGQIRIAGDRLRQLLDFTPGEWDGLRNFSAFSKALSLRLANQPQSLRPPWVLWHPGNGAGRERLELAGSGRVLERRAQPIAFRSGQPSGWVERYRDLTLERELPARLLQTEKLAVLGQMVTGIAHELSNPLTTVMGYGQLLLERPLDHTALAIVHRICQEAERASRIVSGMLLFAREAKFDHSPILLNEIVERTLRLCSTDLHRAKISVEADLDSELPAALGSSVQLQQVVLNLLINSRQAIAETSRPGHIRIRTRYAGGRIRLDVEDDGPGIPAELQSRIFDPFFTTKPVGVGTGLGLAIVKGILRQHEGEITVSSVPGAGATFSLSLPRAPDPREAAGQAGTPSLAPARILVAEEEPGVGRLILDALAGEAHQVELVTDGEQALRRVRKTAYDLVICNWWMPALDGPELCRALAARTGSCELHLLMLAPDPTLCSASDFLRDKKFACLTKPFLLSELKGAVSGLLARQRGTVAVAGDSGALPRA